VGFLAAVIVSLRLSDEIDWNITTCWTTMYECKIYWNYAVNDDDDDDDDDDNY